MLGTASYFVEASMSQVSEGPMADNRLFPPLAALRAFEAVGRLGGIRKAAKELTIDHAVVSRHIRSLETWTGRSLIVRGEGKYTLTDAGSDYHTRVYDALTTIEAATGALMSAGDRPKLRIWCIPGFGFLWLSGRIGDFLASNPDIQLDFRPSDAAPDFRTKEVDGDIRYLRQWEEAAVPKCVHGMEFARPDVFPVASPCLLARMPTVQRAEDLLQAQLLHEEDDSEWAHWFRAQGVAIDAPLPGPRLWHAHVTLRAACQGHGIALANSMLLGDDLTTGRLVRIYGRSTPFSKVNFGGYQLMAREDRWSSPALVRFRRWLHGMAHFDEPTAIAAE